MNLELSEALLSDSVTVALARTTHPGNIGAVARAMKNMGLRKLVLVQPELAEEASENGELVKLPAQRSHEAIRRASGAHDILESSNTFSTLKEALSDASLVIGASARTRKMQWRMLNPKVCADTVISTLQKATAAEQAPQVVLLFGNEASGLSNEELQQCHYHVNIPAVESFASLNLAMAVQLVTYEVRMALLKALEHSQAGISAENKTDCVSENKLEFDSAAPIEGLVSANKFDEPADSLATQGEVEGLLAHLEDTLVKISFLDPENPRKLMAKLRRLYLRAGLEKTEVNILRGILKATLKKINERT